MKKIVIMTRGYYPDMSPVSAVIDKYIQQLKHIYNISVISLPTRPDIKDHFYNGVYIYFIQNTLFNLRLKAEERYKIRRTYIYKFIIGLFRARTALLSFFSDGLATKWERKASYQLLEQIYEKDGVDVVISMSGALTHSHLAAMKFKELHPDVKWITFLTDPITFLSSDYYPSFFSNKRRKERSYRIEKSIYEHADYNILAENLYDDAIGKFNQPKEKTIQFKYVLDDIRKDFPRLKDSGCGSYVRLIYAGALYHSIRNPEYMLSVISKVETTSLDLYVRSHECIDVIKKYESERIVLHSAASTSQYKNMICNEYDILVNIGNNCTNQSPSKMLELLSSGRPIINFYYYKDSQYNMIERYPLGVNIGPNDINAVQVVGDFCSKMRGKQLSFEEIQRLYPENSLEKQTKTLTSLIDN